VAGRAGEGYQTEVIRGGVEELSGLIATLTDQMMQASGELKFELAAKIRDELLDLKKELRQMTNATPRHAQLRDNCAPSTAYTGGRAY
jgi:excinuclease ABC subunit B